MNDCKVKVHEQTEEDKNKRRIRMDIVIIPKPVEITIKFEVAKE